MRLTSGLNVIWQLASQTEPVAWVASAWPLEGKCVCLCFNFSRSEKQKKEEKGVRKIMLPGLNVTHKA